MFPDVPEPDPALSATLEYVRATTSSITAAEAQQQKKKDKGKSIIFDPKKPKKLTIFAASSFPAWQEKYIDLVREAFDATHLTVDDKRLTPQIVKFGETKKSMPFVQGLKRRLAAGENPQTVFERKLVFDELATLREMASALTRTVGYLSVSIVAVEAGGKTGKDENGVLREDLPSTAESAVPGNPTFLFQNVEN